MQGLQHYMVQGTVYDRQLAQGTRTRSYHDNAHGLGACRPAWGAISGRSLWLLTGAAGDAIN